MRRSTEGSPRPRGALDPRTALLGRWWLPLLVVVVVTAMVATVLGREGSRTGTSGPEQGGVTYGASVVEQHGDLIDLRASGSPKPGTLNGATFTVRRTAETVYEGVRRDDTLGSGLPVTVVIEATPDPDGVYRLIRLTANVR